MLRECVSHFIEIAHKSALITQARCRCCHYNANASASASASANNNTQGRKRHTSNQLTVQSVRRGTKNMLAHAALPPHPPRRWLVRSANGSGFIGISASLGPWHEVTSNHLRSVIICAVFAKCSQEMMALPYQRTHTHTLANMKEICDCMKVWLVGWLAGWVLFHLIRCLYELWKLLNITCSTISSSSLLPPRT